MNGPSGTQEIEINLAPMANTRVSYTLNNTQPVRSSFIGAEPMFFMNMDAEDIMDDEGLFDLEGLGLEFLVDEIEELHHKISSYDAISKDFHDKDGAIAEMFAEDAQALSTPTSEQSNLDALTDTLKQSRFADTLLDFAKAHGVEIVYSTQVESSEYDRQDKKIFIHPSLDIGYQILAAAAQLRRVWQHKNGAAVDPMAFYPDHGVLLNRLQEADANAFMIRIAWELKLAEQTEAWSVVENSQFADLGRSFAREACTDFRAANNGKALLSIMEAWFLSERCRQHDRTLIQRMLAGKAPEGFAHSQELSRQALIEAIYALGKNPYGNNYLASHIELLIEDPVFSEVRDRSNANFLWFVKFESAFSQAEQELQSGESSDEFSSNNLNGQSGHNGQLIEFPVRENQEHSQTSASTGTCEVVPFSIRD